MDADLYSLKSQVSQLESQVKALVKFQENLEKEKREKYEKSWHRQDVVLAAVMGFAWGAFIVMMIVGIKHR